MKMSISNFLSWGTKRDDSKERRQEPRSPIAGPMRVYWAVDGGYASAGGELRDSGEGGSGIGFTINKPIPPGTPAWIVSEHEIHGGIVRHADDDNGAYRTGVNLALKSVNAEGWGGVQTRWIDAADVMHVSHASLRNSDEGILEVNCSESAPENWLIAINGPEVSCVCLVKKCAPYGKRFLLEVEAVSDAVMKQRPQAA